jgi:hypothetical protein
MAAAPAAQSLTGSTTPTGGSSRGAALKNMCHEMFLRGACVAPFDLQ